MKNIFVTDWSMQAFCVISHSCCRAKVKEIGAKNSCRHSSKKLIKANSQTERNLISAKPSYMLLSKIYISKYIKYFGTLKIIFPNPSKKKKNTRRFMWSRSPIPIHCRQYSPDTTFNTYFSEITEPIFTFGIKFSWW